jgi:periplasmic protein TonB
MLAYAANRTVIGKRESSPHGLLIVIAAHIALIAVVMSAKMDLPGRFHPGVITVRSLPLPKPPPPNQPEQPRHHPVTSIPISDPLPNGPLPHPEPIAVDPGPMVDPGPIAGGGSAVIPQFPFNVIPAPPVHRDPRLVTPASELRPPYPQSKLLSEEEATLRLKLTISDSGRVISVDPVGAADREFLDAARRYLIAHWRYQPATEDGRAIASSTIITLRFQLDG